MTNEEKIKERAATIFAQYLARHHKRKTPERFAILDVVFDINRHFVADDIFEAIKTQSFQVSRMTVYSTLDLLLQCGLIRRHNFAAGASSYETVRPMSAMTHHHLVCTNCGKIKEIKGTKVNVPLSTLNITGFHPEYYELCIYGLCSRCSKASSRRKN
ncbi:MAG: transcriptional repressor [Muribaculaceae bacterium]|nr:transcriptional repressor [Muribaculaceae bacterium]